jgi:hypothetical protein
MPFKGAKFYGIYQEKTRGLSLSSSNYMKDKTIKNTGKNSPAKGLKLTMPVGG